MKKIISIVLCFALIFSLGMMSVTAADDTTVTVKGATSGYDWDAQTKTLTLDGFSTDDGYINIVGSDVTIKLIGENNTLTSLTHGIMSNKSITFTGSGSLTVNSDQCSIWTEGNDANVTFNGTGTITLKSNGREAMFVDGNIAFNSGTVDATGANGYPAIVTYGVTKKDQLHNITIDSVVGGLDIAIVSTMEAKSGDTVLSEVSVGGGDALSTDEYVKDSYLVSEDGYKYTYDQYTGTITKYDQYGNVLDSYAADNATGASWSYVSTYSLNTLASGNVGYNASNSTYSGAVANNVVVQEKVTEKIVPQSGKGVVREPLSGSNKDVLVVTPTEKEGIDVATFVDSYLKNDEIYLKVFKADGSTEITSGQIATCYVIKLYTSSNGTTPIDEVVVVLKGDANSDGKVSLQDYGKIKTHTKPNSTQKITNVYQFSAADFNADGKVNLQDYGKIKTFTKPKV